MTDAVETPIEVPGEMREALDRRGARIDRVVPNLSHRALLWASTPAGEKLFGWCTDDPDGERALAHELRVRSLIGSEGPLRTPRVLEHGRRWRIEAALSHERALGDAIDEIVAAIGVLSVIELPEFHGAQGRESRPERLVRRARMALSPLPARDAIAAKRLLEQSPLPSMTAHGNLIADHIFSTADSVWLIDWEHVKRLPAGWDLLNLWTDLDSATDRERLFEATVQLVGHHRRAELIRLRYAALVKALIARVTERNPRLRGRSPEPLLALLPGAREEAGV